ncbi:hypothetical protein VTK26DRAFT_5980 [Humicola hyalothermophila]
MPPDEAYAAGDESRPTICVQRLSGYGQLADLSQAMSYLLEPLIHDPGSPHTISALLVALLSDLDLQLVQTWARTGECFIKLVWIFRGSSYPKFTTRHLLVLGTDTPCVSFSGGVAWAQRILKSAQGFQAAARPVSPLPRLPPPDARARQKLPVRLLLGLGPGQSWMDDIGYLRQDRPSASSVTADDRSSVCSELTSATTISDADTEYSSGPPLSYVGSGLLTSEASGPELPTLNWTAQGQAETAEKDAEEELYDRMASQQLQIEALARQSRDAQAMYARNGDTSGFLALMSSANRFAGSWDSGGMPEFQF